MDLHLRRAFLPSSLPAKSGGSCSPDLQRNQNPPHPPNGLFEREWIQAQRARGVRKELESPVSPVHPPRRGLLKRRPRHIRGPELLPGPHLMGLSRSRCDLECNCRFHSESRQSHADGPRTNQYEVREALELHPPPRRRTRDDILYSPQVASDRGHSA